MVALHENIAVPKTKSSEEFSYISIITPGCVRVFVCPSVRSSVRPCVRVKNGNGSRIPDELSPVSRRSQVKVPRVCI